jgi:hypothetical protein
LGVGEFDLGEDLTICEGENTELTAPLVGDYLWSTGSLDPEITVDEEGWVVLEVFEEECGSKDSLFVFVNPLPEFNLGADTVICDTATIMLSAFVDGATYLWDDGSDESSIEVSEDGNYGVTVTLDGCSSEDEITVGVINCTLSTSSQEYEDSFKIFPNPATDNVTLEIPGELIGASILVFSSTGRLIDQLNPYSTKIELDVSGLPKGIYLIKIEKGAMQLTKELIRR